MVPFLSHRPALARPRGSSTERPDGTTPRPARSRSLSDAQAVVLAVAVAMGAWLARPVPLLPAVLAVAAALAARRPWLLCLGGLVLASALGARCHAGLRPVPAAAYRGPVVLVTDPAPVPGGQSAVVRVGGHRLELTARGAAQVALRPALAGEQLLVDGSIRPPPPHDSWRLVRHVVGRIEVTSAVRTSAGGPVWQAANAIRRTLERGGLALPVQQRALYDGFVLGDNRDQTPLSVDDFRAAGLTHLLVVSGENVAFILTLAGPALRRLTLRPRWVATLGVIALFTVVTRFEPSVLRASMMAALAATAALVGRPVSPRRLLALGVAGLILIDPMLVLSAGFGLSVGACLGILVVARPLAAALPGPRPLAQAIGVTVGAQLGVAPLELALFGGLPVASIPANLLAAPAAAAVMVWGVGAGLVAGMLGPPVAGWLHGPTHLLVSWIQWVAGRCAALPLGELGPGPVALLACGVGLLARGHHRHDRHLGRLGGALAVGALALPMLVSGLVPGGGAQGLVTPARGAQLWRGGGATLLVVDGSARETMLLQGLRRARVRRLDAVVARSGDRALAALVADLARRWPVGPRYFPSPNGSAGSVVPAAGTSVVVGGLRLTFDAVTPRLVVRVTDGAAGPSG